MANEVGQAAPRRNDAFQVGITSDPLMGASPKPSTPPKSGGSNFYPPQAPKPPAPPKFGGDPGFKGPGSLKPTPKDNFDPGFKGPSNRKPKPAKPGVTTKPQPYTGPVGGLKQTLPYTGGGAIKNLGGGA